MPIGIRGFQSGHKINVGRIRSEEFCNKHRIYRSGRKTSNETRAKQSLAKLGNIPWNKGKKLPPHTEEWKKKVSGSLKAYHRRQREQSGTDRASLYSEDWPAIRRAVFLRDLWKCQECSVLCTNKETKGKRTIQCHHIDYDKSNNDLLNLITLCATCHAKTHFDRKKWINYFQEKIKQRSSTCC